MMVRRYFWLIGILICLALLPVAAPHLQAQQSLPAAGVQVQPHDEGVTLTWLDPERGSLDASTTLPDLPLIAIDGVQLPMQLVTLRVADGASIAPEVQQLADMPWQGTLPPASEPATPTIDGKAYPADTNFARQPLPQSPVVVLREGRMRGARVVVVAVSPLYEHNGQMRRVSQLRATLPGAAPLSDAASFDDALDTSGDLLPLVAADSAAPVNSIAYQAGQVVKIQVTTAGLQQVRGSLLAEAGIDLSTLNPDHVHVWWQGSRIPLHKTVSGTGSLGPNDWLRFYAPAPGDRWNDTDIYWLTIDDSQPFLAMPTRTATPQEGATASTKGRQQGFWRDYGWYGESQSNYESRLPGVDGDHWYSFELSTGPGEDAATELITLSPELPLAPGEVHLTLTGSTLTEGYHQLKVQVAGKTQTAYLEVDRYEAWTHTLKFPVGSYPIDYTDNPYVRFELPAVDTPTIIQIDTVSWEFPVSLDAANRGISFGTAPDSQTHTITNAPSGSTLYDISDPYAPERLTGIATKGTLSFEDSAPRQYVLSGTGTVVTPEVTAHTRFDLSALANADVLYIAPRAFFDGLAPLVKHRRDQGYTVALVDVQGIYDTWNYGQVLPEALRSALRYAAAEGKRAPVAVTLVGDGTYDPHNYEGRDNANIIPPYMAVVDRWLFETACDTCYAQLDGDNALDDWMPDVMLGRLPVNDTEQLATVVNKILRYETGEGSGPWEYRTTYLTDNYIDPASGKPDKAGDFTVLAEDSIAMHPPGVQIDRLYYDPSPAYLTASWREGDAALARLRSMALINRGSSTVMYIGHSHHWQWATTSLEEEKPYLLGMYDVQNELRNGDALPVVLSMTCLSSSFQYPAYGAAVIDEKFLVNDQGGAVAVWGPTGLGVAWGHSALQRGFYQELWNPTAEPKLQGTLGTLVQAGYEELFYNGTCCQSSLRTFVLLGDPLTKLRLTAPDVSFLPLIRTGGE